MPSGPSSLCGSTSMSPTIQGPSGGTFSVMGGNLPNLTHMPAYFSRKITLAKQNMLAIRSYWLSSLHWRSGATDKRFPFVVITNHRNLKNLRDVQWLNPRHAQWALFFLQFNFHVTYLPGSKNPFSFHTTFELKTILPSSLIVGLIQWSLHTRIDEATTSLRCQLIDSLGLCHPGKQQTLSLIQNRYWWLSMSQDVQ